MHSVSRSRAATRVAATAAAAAAALLLAACSSSSSSSTQHSSSAKVPSQVAATVTKWTTRPTAISVTEPVGKAIPAGKTVAYVHCGLPACNIWASALQSAAKVLGWKAKIYQTNGTPESVAAAWTQVVRDHPDGVIASGLDKSIFASQLAKLDKAGIPVVEGFVTDPIGDGIKLVVGTPASYAQVGAMEAAEAVSLNGTSTDALYVNLPAYQIVQPSFAAFKSSFATDCPSCNQASIDIPVTSLGSASSNTIVSYLRSHPSVNVVVNGNSGLTLGLPAALRAAGLSTKVKIIDDAPTAENYSYIRGGQQEATVNVPIQSSMWQLVDALARIFVGEPITPDEKDPQWWLLTSANLPSSDSFSNVADYQTQYKKLWGK